MYQDPHAADRRLFLYHGDLTDASNLIQLIKQVQPDEIYNPVSYTHLDVYKRQGTGNARREFLHVDDLASACLFLMQHYSHGDIINAGTGNDISIAELAVLIAQVVGYHGHIQQDPSKPDGTLLRCSDISKLRGLGWSPTISLHDLSLIHT